MEKISFSFSMYLKVIIKRNKLSRENHFLENQKWLCELSSDVPYTRTSWGNLNGNIGVQ